MTVITPLKSDSVASIDPNALMTLRCMFSLPLMREIVSFCARNFLAMSHRLPQTEQRICYGGTFGAKN